jgi:hypothetical protein
MTFDKEMQRALEADGEKLRQLTGVDHGPHFVNETAAGLCPRCKANQIDPVLLGTEEEGHICGQCWVNDRAQDERGPETEFQR